MHSCLGLSDAKLDVALLGYFGCYKVSVTRTFLFFLQIVQREARYKYGLYKHIVSHIVIIFYNLNQITF